MTAEYGPNRTVPLDWRIFELAIERKFFNNPQTHHLQRISATRY